MAGQLAGVAVPLGALSRVASAPRQAAAMAGGQSALYGFNSGEGGVLDRAPNALMAGAAGAGVGYGLSRGVEAASPVIRRMLGRNATPEQAALVEAGDRADVRIDASDVRPGLAGTVGFLESMPGSSGRMQRAVAGGRDDIEASVSRLAPPDRAVSQQAAGGRIRSAGERAIKDTGQARDRAYQRAEHLDAGRTSVPATGALQEFDALLGNLGQMKGTNRAALNALTPLRNDLVEVVNGQEVVKPLTIGSLRQFRRGLRDALTNEGVVAGIDDAQLQPVIRAATDDLFRAIETNSGRAAADAFRRADRINTVRQTYIDEVLRPFLGTMKKPTTPQQAFDAFEAIASNKGKGDARTLLGLQRALTHDERIMVNSTIIAKAGRSRDNPDAPFSPALFVTSMNNLSPGAKRVMFGPAGARAIGDLTLLAQAKKNTVGMFNNSRSGKVSNFKDLISTAIFGAGATAVPAVGAMGAVAAAGAGATMIGANIFARVLTNPTFVRALANAPATQNPAAINAYMGRLRTIAARDPNLRGMVEGLEARLLSSANENVAPRVAASGGEDEQQ